MERPAQTNADCPRCRELEQRCRELEVRCREQDRENVRLRKQLDDLQQRLEKVERQGKRQAAPFSKGPPATAPKKPGRRRGRRHGPHAHRAAPPRVDERYKVPLPCSCPDCGSRRLRRTRKVVQYQTEIPQRVIFRQFTIDVGECRDCGRQVRGRHKLQTSTAGGAASSQLGAGVHALLAILNKELGLSHGKSARLLRAMFPELNLSGQLQGLAEGRLREASNARLARHFLIHWMDRFWYLIDPSVQSTNH